MNKSTAGQIVSLLVAGLLGALASQALAPSMQAHAQTDEGLDKAPKAPVAQPSPVPATPYLVEQIVSFQASDLQSELNKQYKAGYKVITSVGPFVILSNK
jgi:hypothetical protein